MLSGGNKTPQFAVCSGVKGQSVMTFRSHGLSFDPRDDPYRRTFLLP